MLSSLNLTKKLNFSLILNIFLFLAILTGQLIKIPIASQNKATLLDILVVVLCILALLKIKLKLKKPPLFILSAISFIIVAILSLIFTPLHLILVEYLVSFSYTLRFFFYMLLGWLIYSDAFQIKSKNNYSILTISGIALAILGILQFLILPDLRFLEAKGWDPHYFRTVSTFLDPNFLGAYLVFTLISLSQNFKFSKINILVFLIVYVALLTTFSRSSYGMFLIGFLTLAFFLRSMKMALLSITLFFILLFSFRIYLQEINKLTPLDRDQTLSYRFYTWQQGIEIFQKNPIFGIGFNSYNYAIREYKLGDEYFLKGKGSQSNDSSLLHIAATTGIMGLIAYFLFLFTLLKINFVKNPGFVAGILGLLAHSFFVNSLFYPFILLWIILGTFDKER